LKRFEYDKTKRVIVDNIDDTYYNNPRKVVEVMNKLHEEKESLRKDLGFMDMELEEMENMG